MAKFPEKWMTSIRLAADGIETLRRSDVCRVLGDTSSPEDAHEMGAEIIKARPDLKVEVEEILEDEFPIPKHQESQDFTP
ncbi:hypothetical protein [Acetobacter persici]|uniref:hypothetical protein n=1 Tax=Acetobacter persici TaxID=1076596 RepID=UPI0012FDBF18|nr:hypothetical protein [Acetobacter persici]